MFEVVVESTKKINWERLKWLNIIYGSSQFAHSPSLFELPLIYILSFECNPISMSSLYGHSIYSLRISKTHVNIMKYLKYRIFPIFCIIVANFCYCVPEKAKYMPSKIWISHIYWARVRRVSSLTFSDTFHLLVLQFSSVRRVLLLVLLLDFHLNNGYFFVTK